MEFHSWIAYSRDDRHSLPPKIPQAGMKLGPFQPKGRPGAIAGPQAGFCLFRRPEGISMIYCALRALWRSIPREASMRVFLAAAVIVALAQPAFAQQKQMQKYGDPDKD